MSTFSFPGWRQLATAVHGCGCPRWKVLQKPGEPRRHTQPVRAPLKRKRLAANLVTTTNNSLSLAAR